MRHERIRKRAIFIDQFVDAYRRVRRRRTFPHREVGVVVHLLFPGSAYLDRGAFKTVHKVYSRARDLVLKTGSRKKIGEDIRAYRRLPARGGRRHRYFARIYWRTKYCLLQKFGKAAKVPAGRLRRLKAVGRRYGLKDIRPANVRKVDGRFKIVDASMG